MQLGVVSRAMHPLILWVWTRSTCCLRRCSPPCAPVRATHFSHSAATFASYHHSAHLLYSSSLIHRRFCVQRRSDCRPPARLPSALRRSFPTPSSSFSRVLLVFALGSYCAQSNRLSICPSVQSASHFAPLPPFCARYSCRPPAASAPCGYGSASRRASCPALPTPPGPLSALPVPRYDAAPAASRPPFPPCCAHSLSRLTRAFTMSFPAALCHFSVPWPASLVRRSRRGMHNSPIPDLLFPLGHSIIAPLNHALPSIGPPLTSWSAHTSIFFLHRSRPDPALLLILSSAGGAGQFGASSAPLCVITLQSLPRAPVVFRAPFSFSSLIPLHPALPCIS
ncbi:hypothetical protein C8R47DRAFT_1139716 [Mycena vitilis]|nr:hypothetical protein C8R47DRAFT_1169362 [Mycena vitilis]KAJ6477880.1 hypothetical protein C8R47DRAFT_1139716 [Mycena vitilis]